MAFHSITQNIRKFLYGRFEPKALLEEYHLKGSGLTSPFISFPESPAEYLKRPGIAEIHSDIHMIPEDAEWPPALYLYTEPEPFNGLCLWYQNRICCECRLIVYKIQMQAEDMNIPGTLLRYEIVTLQQELAAYLADVHRRCRNLPAQVDSIHDEQKNLERFVISLLEGELFSLVMEITGRFGEILQERKMDRQEICLKYLKTPVTSVKKVQPSAEYYRFFTRKALFDNHTKEKMSLLFNRVREAYHEAGTPEIKNQAALSSKEMENIMLLYLALPGQSPEELMQVERNQELLADWIEELKGNPVLNKGYTLHPLLFKLGAFFEICGELPLTNQFPSEARVIIHLLKHCFQEAENFQNGSENEKTPSKNLNFLSDYARKSDVREYFGWDHKKLNNLLDNAGIRVVRFSRKDQWIHKDDFELLTEAHKRPVS